MRWSSESTERPTTAAFPAAAPGNMRKVSTPTTDRNLPDRNYVDHSHRYGSQFSQSVRREQPTKKKFSLDMAGRRQSVTAQITRQARRLSTAIAPQLTKIELPLLMKVGALEIKAKDGAQIQQVLQNYVFHNAHNFEPVDFLILDESKSPVLIAQLTAGHVALIENGKRVCEVSFGESGDRQNSVARIKHPVSGMIAVELLDFENCVVIQTNNSEPSGARIEVVESSLLSLLAKCGCTYTSDRWSLIIREQPVATITPSTGMFSDNAIETRWSNTCDMEMRLVALCFGIVQLVRKAYPQIQTVIEEHRRS